MSILTSATADAAAEAAELNAMGITQERRDAYARAVLNNLKGREQAYADLISGLGLTDQQALRARSLMEAVI